MKAVADDSKEIAGKVVKANTQFLPQTANNVKLCGYLKKKRNKVVGWRKLWFVLQDKLLLSYSSKEEYDNKLVSFKDVLNLVPGTILRPLGGFRFTIETASQHCDDRDAYKEWMSKLLDSLSSTPQSTVGNAQQQFAKKRFDNKYVTPVCSASVDSIPQAMVDGYLLQRHAPLTRRAFVTRSYDEITQVEQRVSTTEMGYTRLPVSLQKVKFLERNVADSNTSQQDLKVFCNRKLYHDIPLERNTTNLMKECAQRGSSKDSYMLDQHTLKNEQTQQLQSNENMPMHVKHLTITAKENKLQLYDTAQNPNKNCRSCQLEKMHQYNQCVNLKVKPEPVYAVVDLQHKYAQRQLRSNKSDNRTTREPKRCNSKNSIIQYRMCADHQLKNPERSSYKEDNIYDEADQLAYKTLTQQQLQPLGVQLNTTQNMNDDTIYEPINITAAYGSNRAFWAYFTQFKVKPLLQFTRLSRRNQCSDYDVIKLPSMRNNFATPPFNLQNENIKHKFGSQRNSIRARLRKLCMRSSYESKPFCNGSGNTGNCITFLSAKPKDTTGRATPQPGLRSK